MTTLDLDKRTTSLILDMLAERIWGMQRIHDVPLADLIKAYDDILRVVYGFEGRAKLQG
jgi:hypothetical protein